MPRNRITPLRAAAASALLLLSLAAPAFAGRDDWDDDDDGHRRGYPIHRHERSCDRDGWDRGGQRGYYGDRYEDRGGYHQRNEYGCRPCGRRWSNRHKFHRHLAHEHGIPFWAFPRVIVQVDWGWMFRG